MSRAVFRNKVVIGGLLLILLLALSPFARDRFRPAVGYRKLLVGLIDPSGQAYAARLAPLSDLQARDISFVIDFYGFRYRGNTRNLIDAHICYYGAFEKSILYFLGNTLTNLGPGAVMIDVGANTGQHSAFTSRYATTVHAFEPFPPLLARLHTLIDENGINNIVVHPIGLGETEAELPFYDPPESNQGTGSFVPTFDRDNSGRGLKLRIVPGDRYFSKAGITQVSVIKMDIEGYEKSALAGLRETLHRHRPIVELELSIDPALPQLFRSRRELESAFPEGYELYTFTDIDRRTGAYRLERFEASFDRGFQFDLVCWPEEKANAVAMEFAGEQM